MNTEGNEEALVKFRGSLISGAPAVDGGVMPTPAHAAALHQGPDAKAGPKEPVCAYCGSADHLDATSCATYLKASMLEQRAQTAALVSIKRSLRYFVIVSVITLVLGFIAALTRF